MHGRSNSAPWNCRTISSHAATSAEVSTCGRRLSEAGTGAAPDRTIPRSASTSGPRVEQVGELRLDARRLVQEGQRPAVGGQCVGQALAVAPGLRLDAGERPARLLGLDRAGGRAIDVQEIVNGTALQRKLAHGDARSGCEFAAARSCTIQPASVSWRSILGRARASGWAVKACRGYQAKLHSTTGHSGQTATTVIAVVPPPGTVRHAGGAAATTSAPLLQRDAIEAIVSHDHEGAKA